MRNNKLIIAVAGSGKTSYLVDEALKITDKNVLITTFTESNRDEIKKKFLEKKKFIPSNITIQTWFSLLLQHGVRPYQSVVDQSLDTKKIGFFLYLGQSALYSSESEILKHFFTSDLKIYSDKISKFVCLCNEKSGGEVVSRISRIFPFIFIDEVQDLAGWDLEILKLILNSSSQVVMVGDPRQAIYDTNDSPKYKKYRGSGIVEFIKNECSELCEIDSTSFTFSHRNNDPICKLASKVYPSLSESKPCACLDCRKNKTDHEGVFLIRVSDIKNYLAKYQAITQLKLRVDTKNVLENYPSINFGLSKGLTFERVLIFPTDHMKKWIVNNRENLSEITRSQLYVALTRARHSVGIVFDYSNAISIEGVEKYTSE